jgi:hypothetical protein
MLTMQRCARRTRLQKHEEQHRNHEPANAWCKDVRLRDQRTEDDGGEDGGSARETGHGAKCLSGKGHSGDPQSCETGWQLCP